VKAEMRIVVSEKRMVMIWPKNARAYGVVVPLDLVWSLVSVLTSSSLPGLKDEDKIRHEQTADVPPRLFPGPWASNAQ
jgi:hypothetical protein